MNIDINNSNWLSRSACPICGVETLLKDLGKIEDSSYQFGRGLISTPASGISLSQCESCSLVIKNVIPTSNFLSEMFIKEAGHVWDVEYDYKSEISSILQYANAPFDILDVGPSNGDFLKNIAPYSNRRSGLDIVQHPKVGQHIRGEFITGLLDSESLSWSGEKYDIITIFDVFEHLYNPKAAMKNLRSLLKPGGLVFIETGDASSLWPMKYGLPTWWYVRLFEHHVFWSKKSLMLIAKRYDFEVISTVSKRHKRWPYESLAFVAISAIRSGLWRISPLLFKKIRALQGKSIRQPRSPFVSDHLLMALKLK